MRRVLIRYGIRPSVVRRPHVWDEGEEDQLIIDWERGFPTPEIRKRYSFNCNTSLYNRLYRIEQKRGIKNQEREDERTVKSRDVIIKAIKRCKSSASCKGCPYYNGMDEHTPCTVYLLRDALRLLDGYAAKPVDAESGNPVCGACGRVILELQYWDEHRMPDYCPWCGTRIGWEKE